MKKRQPIAQNGFIPLISSYFVKPSAKTLPGKPVTTADELAVCSPAGTESWSLLRQVEEILDAWTAQEDVAQQVEAKLQFTAAFACLSPFDQVLLSLSKVGGYNHREIAQLLHISRRAARFCTRRALRRLRVAWQAQNDA